MGDLTANFSTDEFRCKCGCGEVMVSRDLVEGLQVLRNLANAPIRVLSAFRCRKHNAEIGGSDDSQHPKGKASDIEIVGKSLKEMFSLAEMVPVFKGGGIGLYPDNGFIHVDARGKTARWARIIGKYVGIEKALEVL